MTQDNLTYTAVITLTLPNNNGTATANVTLTPPDTIEAEDGRILHLRDCTLADLQAFADQLEVDVWETIKDIKLIDLAEETPVDVTVLDDDGEPMLPLQNWPKQKIVLPKTETKTETEIEDEGVVVETAVPEPELASVEAHRDAPSEAEETAVIDEPSTEKPEPEIEKEVEVTVSEPEPVFPELEVSEADLAAELDDPRAYPTPGIAPSEARVRIAGKRLPIGDRTWTAVDILVDEPALRAAQAHALGSLSHEVAGVLVGPRPEKQPDGRYVVHIIDSIIAKHTVMHGASVTYTPESWRYVNDKLRERYPDETAVIVGWYHTHPGFGIFLSGMDQFIHQNFFTQIWHTALVLDPIAKKSGFFCWDRHKSRVSPIDFAWPMWAAKSW